MINTKDVYPYATIVESRPTYVIYLVKPNQIERDTNLERAQSWPLPPGIPVLARHLERFKPILEKATADRKERRPWWTLHRPRFDVIGSGSASKWEPFCVTTRWGGGNRLVVGLAPGRASPASSLHILRAGPTVADAALLAGVYNSSLYQAIVDSLPPGNVRAEDLASIGMPRLGEERERQISDTALELADLVREMVTHDGQRFPLLPDHLRSDVELIGNRRRCLVSEPGPLTRWGRLADVTWVKDVSTHTAPAARFWRSRRGTRCSVVRSRQAPQAAPTPLFGSRSRATRQAESRRYRCVDRSRGSAAAGPLRARSRTTRAARPRRVVIAAYQSDSEGMLGHVAQYREARSRIDQTLEDALTAAEPAPGNVAS